MFRRPLPSFLLLAVFALHLSIAITPLDDGNYAISLTPERLLVAKPLLASPARVVDTSVLPSRLPGKWRVENHNDGCTEGIIIQHPESGLFLSPSDPTRESKVIMTEEKTIWRLLQVDYNTFCILSPSLSSDDNLLALSAFNHLAMPMCGCNP
ncbi:hypothetical protein B0O80DRAFT_431092 [Mortierella sp. GBAus27b]|nr:hypothetical protein B0O80DRAFT_431092 [Mortierella sp. GBAus27b]